MNLKDFFKALFTNKFNKTNNGDSDTGLQKIKELDFFEEDEVGAYCFFAGKM